MIQAMQARHLKTIGYWMDDAIRLPGGYRIGWDGIIGLIPGLGDVAGLAVSAYIIAASIRMGAPKSVLVRMAANTALDTVVGAIPVVGDLFDFAFKANRRNLQLLQGHSQAPIRTRRASTGWLVLVAIVLILLLAAVVVLVARALAWAWNALVNL